MLIESIREDIEKFVAEKSKHLELVEVIESIYDNYAHYDQIGYGVTKAIQYFRYKKELG